MGNREKKKERAEGEGGSACNKSPYWFNSAVAGGRKIPIGQSDNRVASWCDNRGSIKMATEVDVLSKALADLNVAATREFTLKPEQEVAVRALLHGKNVLAVLPTGYGKSMIYQMFVRAKDYQMNGKAAILVISPLVSIIKDQIQDFKSIGYSAVDISEGSDFFRFSTLQNGI